MLNGSVGISFLKVKVVKAQRQLVDRRGCCLLQMLLLTELYCLCAYSTCLEKWKAMAVPNQI